MRDADRFFGENKARIAGLARTFGDYREPVTERLLKDYVRQFGDDAETGLKTLSLVDYFSHQRTVSMVKILIKQLQDRLEIKDEHVYFSTMSLYPGSSTDYMIRMFRNTSKMGSRKYDGKFLYLANLKDLDRKRRKHVVFFDDFVGSGSTIERLWAISDRWYSGTHRYYLGIMAGYASKIRQIEDTTPMRVICAESIPEEKRVFHENNADFSSQEKRILKKYCKRVDPRPDYVYGYLNTQSLVVFYDNAPNNAIPILHHATDAWKPIFPRSE